MNLWVARIASAKFKLKRATRQRNPALEMTGKLAPSTLTVACNVFGHKNVGQSASSRHGQQLQFLQPQQPRPHARCHRVHHQTTDSVFNSRPAHYTRLLAERLDCTVVVTRGANHCHHPLPTHPHEPLPLPYFLSGSLVVLGSSNRSILFPLDVARCVMTPHARGHGRGSHDTAEDLVARDSRRLPRRNQRPRHPG